MPLSLFALFFLKTALLFGKTRSLGSEIFSKLFIYTFCKTFLCVWCHLTLIDGVQLQIVFWLSRNSDQIFLVILIAFLFHQQCSIMSLMARMLLLFYFCIFSLWWYGIEFRTKKIETNLSFSLSLEPKQHTRS